MLPVNGAAFPAGALGAAGASGFLVVLGMCVQISVGLQLQILIRQPVWVPPLLLWKTGPKGYFLAGSCLISFTMGPRSSCSAIAKGMSCMRAGQAEKKKKKSERKST